VAQLQARIEAAANIVRMDMPSRPPEVPELPPEFYAIKNRLEGVVAERAGYEKGFGLVDSAIAAALKAISDAEGAVVAGAFATRNAPADIQRARQCYASLKEAKEAASKIDENLYADVEAALQSCDFGGARTLIDQMPAGPKKAGFEQEYQAAVTLENRLKALVEKASGEYKSRKYGDALSTLDKALLEAKCDKHLESINNKIAIINEAVLKVYNNAKAALNSCDFEGARKFIDLMPAGPKKAELEQEYQAAIGLENRLKALVGKANGEYRSRNYEAALLTLGGALGEAKCDRHIESIKSKIALVKSKMGPAPEEQVADDEEGKPYYVVFELWMPKPKKKPKWYNDKPPANADKNARKRFNRQLKNKRIQWIRSLTLPKTYIARDNSDKFVVILFTGDSLKAYSRDYFNSTKEFALPINVEGRDWAFLLKVKNVFGGLKGVRSVYPEFKQKKNDIFGGLQINSESGYTTIPGIGPLTEGWSPTNIQKSLASAKFGLEWGEEFEEALPF
jgi:hypothetical protein